jgi:hypothetical protein
MASADAAAAAGHEHALAGEVEGHVVSSVTAFTAQR